MQNSSLIFPSLMYAFASREFWLNKLEHYSWRYTAVFPREKTGKRSTVPTLSPTWQQLPNHSTAGFVVLFEFWASFPCQRLLRSRRRQRLGDPADPRRRRSPPSIPLPTAISSATVPPKPFCCTSPYPSRTQIVCGNSRDVSSAALTPVVL